MTMMMMKMVMMFDGSPSRTRAPSPYKLDPFTPTSRKSTLALRYDTIRYAPRRRRRTRACLRRNLSSVREETRIKKMMMISLVLKFPLGNVSVPKLIIERY